MSRYTKVARKCVECVNFKKLGGRFGVCCKGEHPSDISVCSLFRKGIKYVAVLLVLFLVSCSPRVITIPEIHTEYIVRTDSFVQHDSIHVNDSVFIHSKGDTICVETDTVLKCDSIPYKVEVEKSLSWWERKKIEFGELAMLVLLGLLIFFIIKLRTK